MLMFFVFFLITVMEVDREDDSENEEETISQDYLYDDCDEFISNIKLKKPRVDLLREVLAKD